MSSRVQTSVGEAAHNQAWMGNIVQTDGSTSVKTNQHKSCGCLATPVTKAMSEGKNQEMYKWIRFSEDRWDREKLVTRNFSILQRRSSVSITVWISFFM